MSATSSNTGLANMPFPLRRKCAITLHVICLALVFCSIASAQQSGPIRYYFEGPIVSGARVSGQFVMDLSVSASFAICNHLPGEFEVEYRGPQTALQFTVTGADGSSASFNESIANGLKFDVAGCLTPSGSSFDFNDSDVNFELQLNGPYNLFTPAFSGVLPPLSSVPGTDIILRGAASMAAGGGGDVIEGTVTCLQTTPCSGCKAPPVQPPVPGSNWYQLDPNWASETYDDVKGPKNTIGFQGCALTAFNYLLNAAGEDFDPASLNTLMKNNPGDYSLPTTVPGSGGRINFGSAVTDVTGGALKFDRTQSGQTSAQALDSYLCSSEPHPVMVQVTNPTTGHQHYVVVTGKEGETYSIVDPGYIHPPRTMLSDYGSPGKPPQFQVVGVVKRPSGNDPSELDFSVVDNATLLVTAPDSTQTGLDPSTGTVLKGSPQAAYFVVDNSVDSDIAIDAPTSTTYSVQWFLPPEGSYTVQLNGLNLGLYDLAVKAFDANGKPESFVVSQGVAGVGSVTIFRVQFSSVPGTVPAVTRAASYDSTLSDIANSLRLGLIDGSKLADRLSDIVERAAHEGEPEDVRTMLRAFMEEVVNRRRNIDRIAAQILIEDANSLLGQLPRPKEDDHN